MSRFYARDGSPLTLEEWADVYERSADERRVGYDTNDDVTVSTVWLGHDLGILEGPPLIFETMVFGGEFDEAQEHYATEADAQAGHARWVKKALGR